MKLAFFALSLLSFNAFAAVEYKCVHPELDGDEQDIVLKVSYGTSRASLIINGKPVRDCKNVAINLQGDVDEYGEGSISLLCKNGKKVVLERSYDEMFIDVGSLNMNLGDERYSCE